MQRKQVPAPLSVDMLQADCKVMRLHEKPVVQVMRPSSNYMHQASTIYKAKQIPAKKAVNIRSSIDSWQTVKTKKRTPSPSKISPDTASRVTRSLQNVSPVRKFHGRNSTDLGKLGQSSEVVSVRDKMVNSLEGNGHKTTKVFLSEKQSRSLKECGVLIPCAPPVTPTPEHLQKFDIIPSLTDTRAQRHMRQRLEVITKNDVKKQEKKKQELMRNEKMTMREKIAEKKKRQRQEIYALNRVMTDLEHKHFEDFVREKGYNV